MPAILLLVLMSGAGALLLWRPELVVGSEPGFDRSILRRLSFRGSSLLGFLLLTLGMTSPLALHPTRMLVASGAGPDAFIGVWNLWWTRTAASLGWNPLESGWIFAPRGTSLALHTFSLTYGILSLPIQWMVSLFLRAPGGGPSPEGLFFVYNLILTASFTLSGYFTYRLAREETGHRPAAILAGIAFAYTNFRFGNTVRLHVIATEFLVLALWMWVRLLRARSPAQILGWAGSCVLLIYASLEYAAYAVLLFAVPLIPRVVEFLRQRRGERAPIEGSERDPMEEVGQVPTKGRGPDPATGGIRAPRAWLPASLGALAGSLLLLAPLALQLAARRQEGTAQFNPRLAAYFSADLFDFLLPNPRHPLYGSFSASVSRSFHGGDGGFSLSLGWIVVTLVVVTAPALLRSRSGRAWLWGSALFLVMSLGPTLHVAGHALAWLPLPQAWLARLLPFLAGSRTPLRYIAPAELCLAVTLARGWSAFHNGRMNRPPYRLEMVLGALLLFESLSAPLPVAAVPIPPVYRAIAHDGRTASLVHVPTMTAREDLLYQTVHGQKLIEDLETAIPLHSPRGPYPFETTEWKVLRQGFGTPGWLTSLSQAEQERWLDSVRGFLRRNDVRWVVLARTRFEPTADGTGFRSVPQMEETSFDAFHGALRRLGPLKEGPVGDSIVFEFETTDSK